jgi:hypothetical protein
LASNAKATTQLPIKESKSPDFEVITLKKTTTGIVDSYLFLQTKTVKTQQRLTTVLTAIALSSPAASPGIIWRAAEARYQSWQTLENGHKHFFIHTRASLVIRFSFKG